MWIAFTLKRGEAADAARVVRGATWNLVIERDDHNGPFYPHVLEADGADRFRFVAGRIVGHAHNTLPDVPPFAGAREPDGGFIALEFDKANGTLKIASDVFNAQRWFYRQTEDGWLIANSLRWLYRVSAVKPALELRAVPYLLRMGYIPEPYTPLTGVLSLATGQQLEIEHGTPTVRQRAAIPVERRATTISADAPHQIAELLRDEVKRQIGGLEQVWIPLSGGIDSRFLLACALTAVPAEAIHTMTFGSSHSLDVRIGSALARQCGVKNVTLPLDERSIAPILDDNFAVAEGVYWTVPDYPVRAFGDALPDNTIALSGFVGDPVFGSKEGKLSILEAAAGRENELAKTFWKGGTYVSEEIVNALCDSNEHDPLKVKDIFRAIPGRTMMERYDYWYFGQHSVNRTLFAVTPARAKAFYAMPFIANPVLDLAFALPTELRRGQHAYFAALETGFPEFYNFPTTRNHGFPLHVRRSPALALTRVRRGLLRALDEKLGNRFGWHLFHSPRANYAHPRELLRRKHRADVLSALDALRAMPVLNRAQLEKIGRHVTRGYGVDPLLLRGLLTLAQWLKEYR